MRFIITEELKTKEADATIRELVNSTNRAESQTRELLALVDGDIEVYLDLEEEIKNKHISYCPGDREEVAKILAGRGPRSPKWYNLDHLRRIRPEWHRRSSFAETRFRELTEAYAKAKNHLSGVNARVFLKKLNQCDRIFKHYRDLTCRVARKDKYYEHPKPQLVRNEFKLVER